MFEYEKIQCVCGRKARIVVSCVGTYVHCPYCDKSTYMCTTKDDAIKKWLETLTCWYFFYFGKEKEHGKNRKENIRRNRRNT